MGDGKQQRSISIFCSYAHEDEAVVKRLVKHLRRNHITVWYDQNIDAGGEWEEEIDRRLNNADIILLLLSADFMKSDYCFEKEMPRALERHKAGEACTIPVLLRPVSWNDMELNSLNALPKNMEPVILWKNEETAFVDISTDVLHKAQKILKNHYNDEAECYFTADKHREAGESCYLALMVPYREANLDKRLGDRLHKLGYILQESEHFKKAIDAYESAMRDEDRDILSCLDILLEKGKVQFKLRNYDDALVTYTEAVDLIQKSSPPFKDKGELYENMGNVLIELGRPDEALQAYQNAKANVFKTEASKEKIITLSREIARAFFKWAEVKRNEGLEEFDSLIKLWPEVALKRNKANMVASFGQPEKALELYNEAIAEFPNDAFLFKERGDTFFELNLFTDALDDYNRAIAIHPDYENAKECKNEVLTSLMRERDRIVESLRREEQGNSLE